MLGKAGMLLHDALLRDAKTANASQNGLKHSSCTRSEVRIVATGSLAEHSEGRTLVGYVALLEEAESAFLIAKHGIENGQDAIAHGWSVGGNFLLVVRQVVLQGLCVREQAKGIRKKVDIGLLDRWPGQCPCSCRVAG